MQRDSSTYRHLLSSTSLTCMTWWLLITTTMGSAAPAAEGAQAPPPLHRIAVDAGDLRMVLGQAEQGLRVLKLTDTATGQELLAEDALPLFSATFRDPKSKEMLTISADSGWRQVNVSHRDTPGEYQITFDDRSDNRLQNVRAEVTLTTDRVENALAWDLRIASRNSQWGLWRVIFPQVAVRDLGEAGRVFAQVTSGVELSTMWTKGGKRGGPYPGGWTPMQYMAAYDKTRRTGLYIGMHDPFGSTKDIFAEGQLARHAVAFTFNHPVPNMGQPGTSFQLPGRARWQLLRGDWFDAAQIYRAWVMREARWWPALGPEGRADTPKWMRELPVWVMRGGSSAECVPPVKAFAQTIGLPTGFHWYNWHQIPFDNDYPHYFPVKDGFGQGVAELRVAGVYPMPYINGRLWDTHDKGTEDWQFTRTARAAATKDEQGNPHIETYRSKETDGNSVKLATICPTTSLWQQQVRDIVLRLFNEYGVSSVYIDQIAAARPRLCFDASHGHALGGGHWWTEGYWEMLDAIRAAMPADRMLTTECNAEPYVKWLDGYLTWHWQQQDMVPAFSAVYGGAIQMFGRAYRGGPSQDLANRMKAGQQLVFGEQIGWFGPEVIGRPDCWPFLRDCIQLRWLLRDYFFKGQMARPPKLAGPVPTVTADWQWSGEWPVTTDAIMTGAWRIQDKKVVLLFANVSDSPIASPVEFDPAEYGLADKELTAATIQSDGTRTEFPLKPTAPPEIELPARGVLAWEVNLAGSH